MTPGLAPPFDALGQHVGPILSWQRLGGASTAATWRLDTRHRTYFLKLPSPGEGALVAAEAQGLRALQAAACVRTPAVVAAGDDYLLLSYIEPAPPGADYWETLARQLATQHARIAPCFGFSADNFCGLSPQPNPRMADGYRFFAEHRLGYQAQRAARRGLLDAPLEAAVQALCRRLPELIPTQQPALLHGDLWSGNHFAAADGGPVLVDPACHWGWPEAELAMMCLFEQASDRFFSAYTEHRPLAPGWARRQPLYNLYHLLNHLVLFGTGYLNPVAAILRPFARPGRRR